MDNEKVNTDIHKKKKKHRFLKFLLIIIVIFVGIKIFKYAKSCYTNKKFSELIEQELLVDSLEELELTAEELKQDFNSDGLTNEEKINLGLDILSDDTDGDGLTDYDEINKYGSDPTKFSTSGDVFSDGYKILKGYDINTFYKDSIKIKTSNENVILTAEKAEDTEAYYKEYTGSVPSKYNIVFQPFRVYSFTGQIEVTIENPEYFEVISYNELKEEETKIKNETTENSIIFRIDNDSPILIVYKENILKKLNGTINSNINNIFNKNKKIEYITIIMPIMNRLFGVPVYIYEVNDSVIKDNNIINNLQKELNQKAEGKYSVNVSYINRFGSKILDSLFGWIDDLFQESLDENELSWVNKYVFIYEHSNKSINIEKYIIDGEETNEENITNDSVAYEFEEKYQNKKGEYYADSGFLVNDNAFNFSNLKTTVSNGGVCFGFANITTNIYNNGKMNKVIEGSYDLSSSVYDNIWNKKLYSYVATSDLEKYADDILNNEPILDSANMEKPDSEVVKAIEYHFENMNQKTRIKKMGWAVNSSINKQTYIKSATIDNLVNEFKKGKIATICLLGDGQHAINVYKIVEDENDSDILYLKAYDNNFPADMWWNESGSGKIKYDITITLKRCYKKTIFDGVETYYLYDYNPIKNDGYHYNSIDGGTDTIIFMDENGNLL